MQFDLFMDHRVWWDVIDYSLCFIMEIIIDYDGKAEYRASNDFAIVFRIVGAEFSGQGQSHIAAELSCPGYKKNGIVDLPSRFLMRPSIRSKFCFEQSARGIN